MAQSATEVFDKMLPRWKTDPAAVYERNQDGDIEVIYHDEQRGAKPRQARTTDRNGRRRMSTLPVLRYERAIGPDGNLVALPVATCRDEGRRSHEVYDLLHIPKKMRQGFLFIDRPAELNLAPTEPSVRSGPELERWHEECLKAMEERRALHEQIQAGTESVSANLPKEGSSAAVIVAEFKTAIQQLTAQIQAGKGKLPKAE